MLYLIEPSLRILSSYCGSLLCGGVDPTNKECLKFEGGKFTKAAVTLLRGRERHLCWSVSDSEILLLGGMLRLSDSLHSYYIGDQILEIKIIIKRNISKYFH